MLYVDSSDGGDSQTEATSEANLGCIISVLASDFGYCLTDFCQPVATRNILHLLFSILLKIDQLITWL